MGNPRTIKLVPVYKTGNDLSLSKQLYRLKRRAGDIDDSMWYREVSPWIEAITYKYFTEIVLISNLLWFADIEPWTIRIKEPVIWKKKLKSFIW